MSLRNEQCNKVCRILDDVLANRPTERDSLITAVRKAFGVLETEPQWIPCSERLPNGFQTCIVTDELRQCSYEYDYNPDNEFTKRYGWRYNGRKIIAWMPLPEPYRKEGEADAVD